MDNVVNNWFFFIVKWSNVKLEKKFLCVLVKDFEIAVLRMMDKLKSDVDMFGWC